MNTILILTNKDDGHSDLVIEHLREFNAEFVRFNTEDFPENIKLEIRINGNKFDGNLLFNERSVNLSEIKSVWFRRPIKPNWKENNPFISEEAMDFAIRQREYVLKGLYKCLAGCFWVSDLRRIKETEYKIYQLNTARKIGFKIPNTLITNNFDKAKEFYLNNQKEGGSSINKAIIESTIRRNNEFYGIYTHKIKLEDFQDERMIRYNPCLFQEYVPKKIELRITVVGQKVFAAEIHSQKSKKTEIDWRHYDFENVTHSIHKLPKEIEQRCILLVKKLGLRFGAIDMILTPDNDYIFLEINPNGQWGWIEEFTGLSISKSIAELLIKGVNSKGKI